MGRCPGGADAITIYEGYKCIKTQKATAMKNGEIVEAEDY